MSSTGVEANPMSVGNPQQSGSPTSNYSASRRHHKRTSPEASVSLRHGQLSSSAAEPGRAFAIPPTLRHGNPNSNHGSSASSKYKRPVKFQLPQDVFIGLDRQQLMHDIDVDSAINSNTSGSNERSIPEDWFKSWNTNVGDFNKPYAADGDSPYYLPSERQRKKQKQRADQTNLNARAVRIGEANTRVPSSDPTRPKLNPSFPSMIPTQDSEDESDVYRSVIDDLTIKNKKLKKKLRKMERLHCNELSEEKLFEVRCYGLPPARKQELQELLQKFAADLEGGGGGGGGGGGTAVYESKQSDEVSNSNVNATSSANPSSSSLLQNTDSAYATGTHMTSLDGASVDVSKGKSVLGQSLDRVRGSQSVTIEPRPLQFASERAKMKLVVRRLEQLFTGSDALLSELEMSKEQQQLAEEAAHEKHNSAGGPLGDSGDEDDRREASIMTSGAHGQEEESKIQSLARPHAVNNDGHQDGERRSLDMTHQRPTRPMDIDPNRAQVASENVEYLEHMSLSSSRKAMNFRPAAVGEITGWVYLNLINNLAQIHTLNVSLPFIKKAISQISDKLELSPDGNKVRWRGGFMGTRLSSDGDTSGSGVENSSNGESSPGEAVTPNENTTPQHKQLSLKPLSKKARSRTSRRSARPKPSRGSSGDSFRYRPLMFHSLPTQKSHSEETSEQDSSTSDSESETNNSGPPPILESGTTIGMSEYGKFAPLDGSIIYFGGAPFCTDLSAQVVFKEGGHSFSKNSDAQFYDRFTDKPIGPSRSSIDGDDKENLEPKLLNNFDWSCRDTDMDSVQDLEERLPQLTSIMSTSKEMLPSVMPPPYILPVSGLGGMRPEDNFVVYVKNAQKPTRSRASNLLKRHKIHHSIPIESLKAFTETAEEYDGVGFKNEVTDALHIRLQPSKLPEPVFAISLSEGSSDPFATSSDEPRSYESHLSFAYNIEVDSRSSGDGIPSFHSPEISDESPMDLDAMEVIDVDENPLAPLSVVATAGTLSQDGSVAVPSPKEIPIVKPLDDMDISAMDLLS